MMVASIFGISLHTLIVWVVGWGGGGLLTLFIIRRIWRRLPRPKRVVTPPVNVPAPASRVDTFTVPFFSFGPQYGWRIARIRVEPERRPVGANVYRLIPVLIGVQEVCPRGIVHIADTPYEQVENGVFVYGPFPSVREGLSKMRPYMLHASARSLHDAIEQCGVKFPVLRARLRASAVTGTGQLNQGVMLAAWLDLLAVKLGEQPGVFEARRGLCELRASLLRYSPMQVRSKAESYGEKDVERLWRGKERSAQA